MTNPTKDGGAMTGEETRLTKFDYLLNAFEQASQSDQPAKLHYGDKRKALYAHVRSLESLESDLASARREIAGLKEALRIVIDDANYLLIHVTNPHNIPANNLRLHLSKAERLLSGDKDGAQKGEKL